MKVSVVIPVYNVKPYLERCVNSVLRQTYKDLEIILVDDGSTDGSGELCDDIITCDQRIRVIHQENQGLSGARNTGIRQANGDYIIFMDSDDQWLLDDGLETLVKNSEVETDLIIFKVVDIWSQDHKMFMPDYDLATISQLPNTQAVFEHIIQTQQFRASVGLLMIRTSVLVNNEIFFPLGLISEDVWFDMHLWQYVKTVKVTNLNFYGYYHRKSSLSTTPSIRVDRCYDIIFSYWKEQCQCNCVNADAIRVYMANLWVSRGYNYHRLQTQDRPEVLNILKRHTDLLYYSATPKACRVKALVKLLGVNNTLFFLGIYWRMRTIIKKDAY